MPNQREWLEEFIEIYRSEPCLWKVKAKDYHDRGKKDAAYGKLLVKLQEIAPASDKDLVIKKINNLRCAYKKEHKKVVDSTKSGSGAEDIYEPKLWYYPLLRFLYDQNIPRPSRSNLDDDEDSSLGSASSAVEESTMHEAQGVEESSAPEATIDATSSSSSSSSRKRNSEATLTKDVLISVRDHFKRPAPSPPPNRPDDRFDIFGKTVAFKLRDLAKTQRILAEKIINEALAAAELGSLTTSHTVMAPFPNSPFQQSVSNQSYSPTSYHHFTQNTSPYSNLQSPPSRSPVYEQRPLRNQSQPSQVVLLSIPENPQISDNASSQFTLNTHESAAIASEVNQSQPSQVVLLSIPENPQISDNASSTNSAADYLSNYDAS